MAGILGQVGWVQEVIVNIRSSEQWPDDVRGMEILLDGHMRVALCLSKDESTPVPITLVDLTPHEESLVLLTLDPIAAMAATDKEQVDALIREAQSDDEHVQKLIAQIASNSGLVYESDGDTSIAAGATSADPPERDPLEVLQEKWLVRPGHVWWIGDHQLICSEENLGYCAAMLEHISTFGVMPVLGKN